MKKRYILLCILASVLAACKQKQQAVDNQPENDPVPATKTFDASKSDPKAIELADAVMKTMGGQEKWDDLHYLSWNFFKARDLLWDKKANRVRVDFPRDSSIYILDMDEMKGKVWRYGKELTHPDSLDKYLGRAKSIWINDAYWLVMPFKLKDPGVSLKYLRQDTTASGILSDVIELTFDQVGDTPNNKYEVYIDRSDQLVKQWAFFKDAKQDEPSAVWPWDNYKDYQGLLLSSDRSDNKGPFEVKVHQTVPEKCFEDFNFKLD